MLSRKPPNKNYRENMKYKQIMAGEWARPTMKGHKMMCCDCGLVHQVDFKVIHWGKGHKVLLKSKLLKRATGQARRHMKTNE